jgi:hypothetical protein
MVETTVGQLSSYAEQLRDGPKALPSIPPACTISPFSAALYNCSNCGVICEQVLGDEVVLDRLEGSYRDNELFANYPLVCHKCYEHLDDVHKSRANAAHARRILLGRRMTPGRICLISGICFVAVSTAAVAICVLCWPSGGFSRFWLCFLSAIVAMIAWHMAFAFVVNFHVRAKLRKWRNHRRLT